MKIVFKRTNAGAALLGSFLCMSILFLITLYRDGGQLHSESSLFFMNYLDGRPLLNRVFDPARNDWGCYQARELSYFFDLLDARFIAFLLQQKIIWFHSLCSLIACGLIVFIQQYFTRKYFPKVPGILVTVMSCFFVLSGVVSGLDYFRSAKYLAALGLWGAFFSGYALFRWKSRWGMFFYILSLLLMVLSDRQGFFFAAVFCGTAAVLMLWQSWNNAPVVSRRMKLISLTAFGSVCFGIVNNLFLTPFLIRSINGYAPDFSYQRDFTVTPGHIWEGIPFFFSNLGSWFNNFTGDSSTGAVTGLLLTGGICFELLRQHNRGKRWSIPVALCWGCAIAAMVICSVIMVARFAFMTEPEFFYGVYTITFLSLVLCLLTLTAAGAGKKFCKILLIVFCFALFLRLGGELAAEKFFPERQIENGVRLRHDIFKKALKDPAFDEKKYLIPHRMELFLKFYRERVLTKE